MTPLSTRVRTARCARTRCSNHGSGCDARFGEKLATGSLPGLVDHLNDSYYKFTK